MKFYNACKHYGIVQGRLSPQVGDFIQNFPNNWREEFKLAKKLGVSHIEWIDGAPNSPIEKHICEAMLEDFDVPVSGICLDWIVRTKFLTKYDLFLNQICIHRSAKDAIRLGINRLVVPLLESASLQALYSTDEIQFHLVVKMFDDVLRHNPNVVFSFETDMDIKFIKKFIDILGQHKNFSITFDIGNLTKLSYNLEEHLSEYWMYVDGVHIKDCVKYGTTVPLGSGDTDLTIVRQLAQMPTLKFVTFQTARNPGLSEAAVFEYNVKTIEKILNECI